MIADASKSFFLLIDTYRYQATTADRRTPFDIIKRADNECYFSLTTTTMRPPAPGTIPRGASRVMDYGKKRFVPEIGKNAWGHVDYERALSTAEIADYELFPYPKN